MKIKIKTRQFELNEDEGGLWSGEQNEKES